MEFLLIFTDTNHFSQKIREDKFVTVASLTNVSMEMTLTAITELTTFTQIATTTIINQFFVRHHRALHTNCICLKN